jgi:hypothetical protein
LLEDEGQQRWKPREERERKEDESDEKEEMHEGSRKFSRWSTPYAVQAENEERKKPHTDWKRGRLGRETVRQRERREKKWKRDGALAPSTARLAPSLRSTLKDTSAHSLGSPSGYQLQNNSSSSTRGKTAEQVRRGWKWYGWADREQKRTTG